MTSNAVREPLNFVIGDELWSDLVLIRSRSHIRHVEHLFTGPHISFRIAMAFNAPLHVESIDLINERHLVNTAVAGGAANAFADMNAVIEIHKIGKVVNASPLERFPRAIALANRREHLRVRPKLRVATHACLSRGNPGEIGGFNRGVAIAAVDPVVDHMVFVAKRNTLIASDVHVGNKVSRVNRVCRIDDAANGKQHGNDSDFSNAVRAAMK